MHADPHFLVLLLIEACILFFLIYYLCSCIKGVAYDYILVSVLFTYALDNLNCLHQLFVDPPYICLLYTSDAADE